MEENKFKVGDLVRRKEVFRNLVFKMRCKEEGIKLDSVLQIIEIDSNGTLALNHFGATFPSLWSSSYFEYASPFKVGDVIVNNDVPNNYYISTKSLNYVGKVVCILGAGEIEVKTISCDDHSYRGKIWNLETCYFKLKEESDNENLPNDEMEQIDLTKLSKASLKEAQSRVLEERQGVEVSKAMDFLRLSLDRMDTLEGDIETNLAELKEIKERLKIFSKKA